MSEEKSKRKASIEDYVIFGGLGILFLSGLVICIRGFSKHVTHQLESADAPNYGTGIEAFFRKLFNRPKKTNETSLSDETKHKINMQEFLKANGAYFKILAGSHAMMSNMNALITEMKAQGITNLKTQSGILSVVSKETNFVYKREDLKDYTSARLQKVFALPKATADKVAGNEKDTANVVYMPPHNTQLGNTQPNDGWLYRGGGANQLTGRAEYKKYGDTIGVDLVNNPDLIDTPEVAAKVCIAFFKDGFASLMKTSITKKDGTKVSHAIYYNNPTGDINGFKSEQDSAAAFYNINAGIGQTEKFLLADVTGGRALCMARATGFLQFLKINQEV